MLTKKQLKSRYVAQRREDKIDYIQRTGSAKGWKSSDGYKRIERNEKQAFYRREKREQRQKAEQAAQAIEKQLEEGKPAGQLGLRNVNPISVGEFFWTSLNARGNQAGSIIEEYEDIVNKAGTQPTVYIKDFDGNKQAYTSKLQAELKIQDMYNLASKEQTEARKAGVKGTSAMHTIDAVSAQLPDGSWIITVEGNRM